MQIPNPYKGNYKLLIILPLILVALSLFFIPQIKKGVDFKGGTLVVMQTQSSIDAEYLKNILSEKNYLVSSVKSLQNPKGFQVEVEIERDESLTMAEELKTKFFEKIDEVSRREADVLATNNSAEAVSKYKEARAEIDKIADELFGIANENKNASSLDTNSLRQKVSSAYRKIIDDYSEKLSAILSEEVKYESASFDEVSASLSEKFLEKAFTVVLYSTIFVSIVVFFIFRTFIPSLAVLLGAACDVIIALGAMGLFGIPLTLASFAALLILVGFSLDTDVLLTMRVIKRREGEAKDRAYDAMKTGATMSMALILTFFCLYILAFLTNISTYYEISAVALSGLVGDLFATWCLNAVIVLAYVERKSQVPEAASSVFSG